MFNKTGQRPQNAHHVAAIRQLVSEIKWLGVELDSFKVEENPSLIAATAGEIVRKALEIRDLRNRMEMWKHEEFDFAQGERNRQSQLNLSGSLEHA
jgi:hypothetical protein